MESRLSFCYNLPAHVSQKKIGRHSRDRSQVESNVNSTLERIDPDAIDAQGVTGGATLQLHLERYRFASSFVPPNGRVLDIACGVGYGSKALADSAADRSVEVTGVDCSTEALAIARSRYQNDNVRFVLGDCMQFSDEAGFDLIASLETVEHLPEPELFVRRLVSLLKPTGALLVSVPITPSVDFNRHHLNDFSRRSITAMVRRAGLRVIDSLLQTQPFNPFAVLARSEERLKDGRRGLPLFYLRHPQKLALRLSSIARDGFCNKYLTLACRHGAT
jgi:2-polyprenyl-3-methyl-5-hydroxy-6-metoxy-1,4-benzoquinol methylase